MKRSDALRAELERIRQANGGLLRQADIVEAAKPEESILHDEFTWEDSEAAEEYRLHEAGILVRRVKVTLTLGPVSAPTTIRPRVYQSLPEDRHSGGGYRSLDDLRADPVRRAQMLESVRGELAAIRRRFGWLQELDEVWSAIDRRDEAATESRPIEAG